MILYFSATGNSRYAAQKIAEQIGDRAENLFDRIRNRDYSPLESEKPWVLVVPTYSWQIPHIVEEWLEKTRLTGSKKLYTVMTCGGNIGNAGAYIEKLCAKKGMEFCGCTDVVMPDNYIVMFTPSTDEEAKRIIADAESSILSAAEYIKNGKSFPKNKITVNDRLMSGAVNVMFYTLCVKASPFYATDDCVSCGHCEKVCPLGNIRIENGKPVWGKDCTHCMACICTCPKQAIEYGKKTKGKARYQFPENI